MLDIYYPSSNCENSIHACIWQPEGTPLGIVQLVHGMAEYAQRYAPFAEHLAQKGFVVCAEDHLGHGKSVGENKLYGFFSKDNPAQTVLDDIRSLTLYVKGRYPDLPIVLLGHSMGSFFTRRYISTFPNEVDGAIIMGSGGQAGATLSMAKFLTKVIAAFKGWEHKSNFIDNLAFGAYNKKFKPNRTKFDWLSVDESNVDKYILDELCGFKFTCNGFYTLFSIIQLAQKKDTYLNTPSSLPLFIVAGEDDPVGGYSKEIQKLYDRYVDTGHESVSMTIYKGARHEILNDISAPQVYEDIIEFLSQVCDIE